MDDPIWLTLDEVLRIHKYQVEHFGGDPAILDLGKLESALAQPAQMFGGAYLHEDVASMAAAYLFHIVQNHAFADGNKRTGTHAALVFLELNGFSIEPPVDDAEQLVIGVATDRIGKPAIASQLREWMAG